MDNTMNALSNETLPTSVFNFDIKSILTLDDFEECRARASSGGSLYGVLRRQAFLRSPGAGGGGKPAPGPTHRPMQRQRSRSLIQRSVALPEDKSLLKMLCDYSEMTRRQQRLVQENRRHSEATLLCDNRLQKSPVVRLSRSATPSRRVKSGTPSVTSTSPASPRLDAPNPDPSSALTTTTTTTTTTSSSTTSIVTPTTVSLGSPDHLPSLWLAPPKTVYRRRSFARTQHGLVSGSDETVTMSTATMTSSSTAVRASSFPEKGSSGFFIFGDDDSSDDRHSEENCRTVLTPTGETPLHRVLILGGPGVGKTAITQQFLTSEYMAAQNTSFDDGVEITISVVVDGEESILELIDLPYNGELNTWQEYDVDGFVIVYSIIDRRSYQKAIDLLCRMRNDIYASSKKPVILVANKSDLERSRIISKQEGKTMAEVYDSKYIDVSAILNHRVDDLLVGMLKQLRLSSRRANHQTPTTTTQVKQRSSDDSCLMACLAKSKGTLLKTFVRQRLPRHSKSCENLLRV